MGLQARSGVSTEESAGTEREADSPVWPRIVGLAAYTRIDICLNGSPRFFLF